jgi:BAAT / Acyl-CoA thioester hydrolase C terminal
MRFAFRISVVVVLALFGTSAFAREHLDYADAGHAIVGLANVPATVKTNSGELRFGGTYAANASARADAWRQALRFLGRELG